MRTTHRLEYWILCAKGPSLDKVCFIDVCPPARELFAADDTTTPQRAAAFPARWFLDAAFTSQGGGERLTKARGGSPLNLDDLYIYDDLYTGGMSMVVRLVREVLASISLILDLSDDTNTVQ